MYDVRSLVGGEVGDLVKDDLEFDLQRVRMRRRSSEDRDEESRLHLLETELLDRLILGQH